MNIEAETVEMRDILRDYMKIVLDVQNK